jgi:TRAP-type C4-dicarboxylate transport system substrate-binding protein
MNNPSKEQNEQLLTITTTGYYIGGDDMKKQLAVLTAAVALNMVVWASVSAETITLRFAHQNPDTGLSTVYCVEPWIKQVEEATGGKVKIQPYYSQTLAKGKDMWNATKMGITDIGWCFYGYWTGMTPLTDVVSLPCIPFKSAEKGSEVLWKLYEQFPEIAAEHDDVKILLFYTSEPYSLITVNKPVTSIEDIKGMKVRMTGGPPTDMMKLLGGVPMMIGMPDNYISLQKGVIDGMSTPWEAIHVWRFYEVVKYYTEVPFPAVYFSVAINKRKWERLPKDVQDAIMSVSGLEGSRFWGRNFCDRMKTEGIEKIKTEGHDDALLALSPEENQRWIEVGGKPLWAKWVKDMEAKGYKNAQEILDTALQLAAEE